MAQTLRVASDLHLDSYRRSEVPELLARLFGGPSYDVAVIAGDVANCPGLADALAGLFAAIPASIPVVYVPGNHEHYESPSEHEVDRVINGAVSRAQRDNVHVLRSRSAAVAGLRFLGTTLWYENNAAVREILRERVWPDFRHIPYIAENLDAWNARDKGALAQHLPLVDVVVTHMLPHTSCVSPRYQGDRSNAFFVNDQGEALAALATRGEVPPPLWIFGHTHEWVDVHVGCTHMFARPVGYRKEYTERNDASNLAELCTVTASARA